VKLECRNLTPSGYQFWVDQLTVTPHTASPFFYHTPAQDVTPTPYPGANETFLNFSVDVYNTFPGVATVILQENLTGVWQNHTMISSTLNRYSYRLNISLFTTGVLGYRFLAYDHAGEYNETQVYLIYRDFDPPDVESWTTPSVVEYDDSVTISVHAIDALNAISHVTLWWTADNVTRHEYELTKMGPDLWQTLKFVPPHPYNTTIFWEVQANDTVGNAVEQQFSYTVFDLTPPDLVGAQYVLPVLAGVPFPINLTIIEPEGASGINPDEVYLGFQLESEGAGGTGYLHLIKMKQISGTDIWTIEMFPMPLNETVYLSLQVTDRAGNGVLIPLFYYTPVERAELINWGNFGWWTVLMLGLTLLLLTIRRYSTRRRGISGARLLGVSMVLEIGMTAGIWMTPFSWLNLQYLAFQEWLLQVQGSDTWYYVIVLLFLMFFIFALSIGTIYAYDKKRKRKEITREIGTTIQYIESDLRTLE